jgi:predicted PurR-regulated permease PerM
VNLGKLIGLLAFAISLYILWTIRYILLLIFAAIVFAIVLNRVVRWLQQQGVKRGIAITLSVISLLGILFILFALIGPSFVGQLQQFVKLIPTMIDQLRNWLNWLQTQIPEQLLDVRNLGNFLPRLQPVVTGLLANVYTWFTDLLAIILKLLLVLVLIIMLVVNPSPYRRGLILLFPAFYRYRADEILSECEETLVGWVTATLITMGAVAGMSFIGLSILQVPLPLANALFAGLLEFIPNIGPTLSVIPPVAVALLDTPWKAVAVLILYFVIQQVESFVLVPFLMKQQVSLLPAVTLLSVIIFGTFFGFLGVFLAVPLVIICKIWLNEVLIKDVLNNWHKNEKENSPQDAAITNNRTPST